MKVKIGVALIAIFSFFSIGILLSMHYVPSIVSDQTEIIEMHQVEQLRRSLMISLQNVQTNLYTYKTSFSPSLNAIVENFNDLEASAKNCSNCHHRPELQERIDMVEYKIEDYGEKLSNYITLSANAERQNQVKTEAAQLGLEIEDFLKEMSHVATMSLEELTEASENRIRRVKRLLMVTLLSSFLVSLLIAWRLLGAILRPIRLLLDATNRIASGKLGTTIDYGDKTEFGVLAQNFNAMSLGLKEGYDGLQMEIAERIKVEESLRESRERYELAARGANDGLWDWDIRSGTIFFSPRWKAMLGYGEDEVAATIDEWLKRVHPDDVASVETELRAHMDGHTHQFQNEHRMLDKEGSYRWMLTRGLAVRDELGMACRMAGSQTDITERKVAEQQLLHDALHDAMTGLPNRALFLDRLRHAAGRSSRNGAKLFAVVFLDLDRFKVTNDSLGHMTGDRLLVAVSQRLSECLRPGDTVARFGGDEFAILVEYLRRHADLWALLSRIRTRITAPFRLGPHEVFSTVSMGVCFSDSSFKKPEDLIRNADIAMYHAKANGRDGFEVFDEGMYNDVMSTMQLEIDLRKAIDNQELLLFYQPIVSSRTAVVVGFEALARWRHPTRGIVPPTVFIPIAEESGMILPIGEWVLREASAQLEKWQAQFPIEPQLTMNVNVSGKQLLPCLVEQVHDVLAERNIDPATLILEITETVLMEKAELVSTLLEQLKEQGVQLQIDDFGTGYSSLSYLHNYPIDALKIDRSFTSMIDIQENKLEIVRTITELARGLKMYVVAEGVESQDQVAKLRQLECQRMQGFLFAKPLPVEKAEEYLERQLGRPQRSVDVE